MKKTVITIARSYGSGGRTLGKLLAEELGINFATKIGFKIGSNVEVKDAVTGETRSKPLDKKM